ncbi:MAG TPA: hypothetical protein V6C90_23185 [Coleofasciculaceae cyanobacterium]
MRIAEKGGNQPGFGIRGAICATLFTRFAIALSSLKDVPLEVNPKGNAKTPCAALSCN